MTYVEPLISLFLTVGFISAFAAATKSRRLWVTAALTGILLSTWPPVPWAAGVLLEHPYDGGGFPNLNGAEAIVVLGANVLPPEPWNPEPRLDTDSFHRTDYAALLFRRNPGLPIIVSGRSPYTTESAAATLRHFLLRQSIPSSAVWIEDQSTSTKENAEYSGRILRSRGIRRIVLVTHASHMRRAASCFRKQGIEVIAAPSGFTRFPVDFVNLLPGWRGLQATERLLHEYAGLAWYSVRGYL